MQHRGPHHLPGHLGELYVYHAGLCSRSEMRARDTIWTRPQPAWPEPLSSRVLQTLLITRVSREDGTTNVVRTWRRIMCASLGSRHTVCPPSHSRLSPRSRRRKGQTHREMARILAQMACNCATDRPQYLYRSAQRALAFVGVFSYPVA